MLGEKNLVGLGLRMSRQSGRGAAVRSASSVELHRASLNRCPGLLVWNYSSTQDELESVEKLFSVIATEGERETCCTHACLHSIKGEYAL